MKNLFSTTLLAASLLLTTSLSGCQDKADDPQPATSTSTSAQLVGTWNGTSIRQQVFTKGGQPVGDKTQTLTPGELAISFTADGNFQSIADGVPARVRTYTVVGDKITLASPAGAHLWIVKELTASRLILEDTEETSAERTVTTVTLAR